VPFVGFHDVRGVDAEELVDEPEGGRRGDPLAGVDARLDHHDGEVALEGDAQARQLATLRTLAGGDHRHGVAVHLCFLQHPLVDLGGKLCNFTSHLRSRVLNTC